MHSKLCRDKESCICCVSFYLTLRWSVENSSHEYLSLLTSHANYNQLFSQSPSLCFFSRPFFIHLKYPSCISLKTLLQLDSFSITSQEETSFLLSVFHLLVLLPSVCLHAPLTSVYVHVCVCVWVHMAFSLLIVRQVKLSQTPNGS